MAPGANPVYLFPLQIKQHFIKVCYRNNLIQFTIAKKIGLMFTHECPCCLLSFRRIYIIPALNIKRKQVNSAIFFILNKTRDHNFYEYTT